MQSTVLGIDLGTTNSLASVLEGGDAVLIPNGMGDVLTPSIVAVSREGEVVVGRAARELQAHTPDACRALFKRDMGTDVTWELGGQKLSPQMLSSLILQSLRRDAAEYVGEDVSRAVITVPAYFNDAQRQATKDAGELAGLQVERILAEPTAAALAYGLHVDPARRRLLVFDLGGGTFDVSILDCEDGILEVLASAGESQLGGEDYTQRLMAELLARRHLSLPELEASKPILVAKFRYRIEQAKKSLTGPESAVSIPVPDFDQNQWTIAESITITGADLVDCSHSLTERFEPVTWRALRDAQLGPAAIDEVLLVGGASRMYLVHEFIEKMFGKAPKITIDPDTVVARGAAVQGGLIAGDSAVEEIVATDVMPHTLGCNVSKELGNELRSGYFMPIIHRNTTIPTSRTEVLGTTQDGQTAIEIEIYQGESRMVADNLLLGKLKVDGLRPRLRGEESITVRYTYDLNGILEVEATGDSDGKTRRLVIERRPGTLTDKQRERALRAMKSLKIELRDQDQNRFLLERGRRIYTETSPFYRDQLDYLLTEFERSLADRDPQRVDAARNELEIFLSFLADTVEGGSGEQNPEDRGPDGA